MQKNPNIWLPSSSFHMPTSRLLSATSTETIFWLVWYFSKTQFELPTSFDFKACLIIKYLSLWVMFLSLFGNLSMDSFTNVAFIDMTCCVDGTRESQWLWTWCYSTNSFKPTAWSKSEIYPSGWTFVMKQYIFRTNSSASDPYFFNPAQKLLRQTWIRHCIFKFWSKITKNVWEILNKLSFRKKKHICTKKHTCKKKLTKNKSEV